jgi:hypothetical protein
MYLMAGLLIIGFVCNLAVRPVAERHYMSDEQLSAELAGLTPARSRARPG